MDSPTQHGYLVLADLSGYTAFLAGTETEHSLAITADLLGFIAAQLRPVFPMPQVEGGAVFAHAPEENLPRGEALLETVEAAYLAFRDHRANVQRQTTCACGACRNIPNLDLKILAHHGAYIAHTVKGHSDFMGLDVSLVRERVLKAAGNGTTGYVIFTEACLAHMAWRPPELLAQELTYAPLGKLMTYRLDLQARYAAYMDARRVALTDADAHAVLPYDFHLSPPALWDWLTAAEKRSRWMPGRTWKALDRPGGRTAAGARNHCAHGYGLGYTLETILDWRPFDYFTSAFAFLGGQPLTTVTFQFAPLASGGTRLHTRFKFTSPLLGRLLRPLLLPIMRAEYTRLVRIINAAH